MRYRLFFALTALVVHLIQYSLCGRLPPTSADASPAQGSLATRELEKPQATCLHLKGKSRDTFAIDLPDAWGPFCGRILMNAVGGTCARHGWEFERDTGTLDYDLKRGRCVVTIGFSRAEPLKNRFDIAKCVLDALACHRKFPQPSRCVSQPVSGFCMVRLMLRQYTFAGDSRAWLGYNWAAPAYLRG